MNLRIFLFILILPLQNLFAQDFSITGKVLDKSTTQALSFSTVAVLDSNNKIVKAVNTLENGQFKIENMSVGKYKLQVSFVGYTNYEKAFVLKQNTDFGTINLSSDAKILKEVDIKAEKDLVSMNLDKKVFNVGKNLTSIGSTAESLLRNIPSISIDETGSPSLRNMATTIYINGKPTQLTLAQIPANQIESVEVITNPSAKYDASTSGGIVNLILKKNRENGYNGNASIGIGNNNRLDGSLNFDYHQGKWNFSAMFNGNATQNPLDGYVNRTNYYNGLVSGYFNQNTLINLNNQFLNSRVTIENEINAKNTVGVAFTAVKGVFNSITNQNYQYLTQENVVTSSGSRNTTPNNAFSNLGVEFNWKHRFDRKKETFDLRLSANRNKVSNAANWFTSAIIADETNQAGYPETDKITGQQLGNQYLGQLDYVRPINDSTKFEMGLRSYTFVRDQQYFFNQVLEKGDTLLQNYSQNARITESVNAIYFLFNKQLKNNYHLETGLRLEQSLMHGLSRFDNSTFGYNYPSVNGSNWFQAFFPSFSLSKQINKDAEIGLSLGRKVGRPSWRHMFVGIQSNDRQNITIGNPNIKPEFVNTAELNYSQNINKLSWVASLYYIYEDHTIKPFVQKSTIDTTILVTTFINTKADIQLGFDNTFKYSIGNFSTTANINAFKWTLSTYTYQNSMWAMRAKLGLSYKLPAGMKVQINMNRDSKMPTLQGYRLPVNAADFAISKSIYKGRGNIVFAVNDVFNSRKYRSVFESANLVQTSMTRREIRFYKLTIQIPLGKPNASLQKKDRKLDRPDIDFSN